MRKSFVARLVTGLAATGLLGLFATSALAAPAYLLGKAEGWIGKSRVIKSRVLDAANNSHFLTIGYIAPNGKFAILLPSLAQMRPYSWSQQAQYELVCPGSVTVKPDVKTSKSLSLAVFEGGAIIGDIKLLPDNFANPGDVFSAFMFSSGNSKVHGNCKDSSGSNLLVHVHEFVPKGWFYDINELFAPDLAHEYSGRRPAETKWTFVPK